LCGQGRYDFPQFAEVGKLVTIHGKFDGNRSNTLLSVGGKLTPIFGETQNAMTFRVPPNLLGKQTVSVTESGMERRANVRVLQIKFTPSQKTVKTNGILRTKLTVSGLLGVTEPVALRIVIDEPGFLDWISPDQINKQGRYLENFHFVRLPPGPTALSASVVTPRSEQEEVEQILRNRTTEWWQQAKTLSAIPFDPMPHLEMLLASDEHELAYTAALVLNEIESGHGIKEILSRTIPTKLSFREAWRLDTLLTLVGRTGRKDYLPLLCGHLDDPPGFDDDVVAVPARAAAEAIESIATGAPVHLEWGKSEKARAICLASTLPGA
jgi:hypothetical protein